MGSERPVDEYSRGDEAAIDHCTGAAAPEPSLLLLDEPLTGLDRGGVNLATELFASAKAREAALLVSSHDLIALDALTDEVLCSPVDVLLTRWLDDEPDLYGRVVEGVTP